MFTALDDVSLNTSNPLPSHVWFQFLVAIAPSLTRCTFEFCADLPGDLIFQALGPNCRNLQQLTLRFTPYVYALDTQIFLNSVGHSLRELRLEDCIGVDDQLVIAIADACDNLECLCLGGSEDVGDDGILAIAQSPCANTLKTLDIRSCMQVTDEGVFAIATSCYALKSLNLWAVCVTSYGVRAVAEGLGVELETLIIGDCIGVDDTAVQSIADNCDALVTLEMCGLQRITDDGIMALFDTNRTGQLELENLTIDRCTNVTSRGVLAATGLLHDARTTSRSCQLQSSQPSAGLSSFLPTPCSANEHPDINKRKQSRDWVDDGASDRIEVETHYGKEGEDWRISSEQHIPENCKTDITAFYDADSSLVNSYVSHLRKLSAVKTAVGPSAWHFIRECRKELDLIADDCEVGVDDVWRRRYDCQGSENLCVESCVDGAVLRQKRNGLDVFTEQTGALT